MTGSMDGEPQEDILDRCIQRLLQGEPLDRVLRSYPDQQLRLRAELEPALALLQSNFAEGPERTRAVAAYGAVAGIGASIGLVLGGLLALLGLQLVVVRVVEPLRGDRDGRVVRHHDRLVVEGDVVVGVLPARARRRRACGPRPRSRRPPQACRCQSHP